jgi:predicted CXXCH cytochrome family protein
MVFSQWSMSAVRLPSANRECASCHIMWLTEFKRKDVTPLIAYDPKPVMKSGKQDVASSEPVCFSCHDGFVLESRFLWEQNKHAHPVGQKPSDKINIPIVDGKNIFPLNDDGRMYCGTCHSAHGVDWEQKKTAVFMRVANEDGQLCMACHTDKVKGPDHGSHPLKRKIQKLLDKPPQHLMDAGARFANDGEVICQSCHTPHAAPEKKILLVKNDESQLCGECHVNRYAKSRAEAGMMGTHPVNIKPQNVKVPKELLTHGSKLGANGEVICQSCHRPHDAVPNTSLLVVKNKKDSLCQSCHKTQKTVLNSKHDMSLARKTSQNIRKQVADEGGACSACHVPHKGKGLKMWARDIDKIVAVQDPMAALCLSCHNKKGIASKHTTGKYSHPVGINISRLGRKVNLPTFDSSGMRLLNVKSGNVTCASCHDPHQWSSIDSALKGIIGESGDNKNRFLRKPNAEDAALCKTCHEDKWRIAKSKHDMRYMAPDAKNSSGQTVSESGICGACHLVHNASAERLWARSDLGGNGTGYAACLGCHNEKGLARNKTLGKHTHPINVPIKSLGITAEGNIWTLDSEKNTNDTGKINLKPLPLYDELGRVVDENGRVGCGSCHDPHSWSQLAYKQIKNPSRLEGDTDSSFLRIADKSQSALCVNCHVQKKSIYLTKHDLTDNADDYLKKVSKKNIDGENKLDNVIGDAVAGACMHCHQPHNAKGVALWARSKGNVKAPIAALCADCHQQNNLAGSKLPGKHMHPLQVDSKNIKHNNDIPFFDSDGNRDHKKGKVDCASCHNPHQWNPDNVNIKSPEISNIEGLTSSSFLRKSANNKSELCVSCHVDKKTIFGTDHDLSVTAPDAINTLQQNENESGVCGQCHIPHQSKDSLYLWARELSTTGNLIEQRCTGCHANNKIAAAKVPIETKHPQQIKLWSPELREKIYSKKVPEIPVFDEQGRRTKFGSINCASCHNPHQWQADKKQPAIGVLKEGDAMNSFLRSNDSANIVCQDCHGNESIYRYKYFHTKEAHKKHHMYK